MSSFPDRASGTSRLPAVRSPGEKRVHPTNYALHEIEVDAVLPADVDGAPRANSEVYQNPAIDGWFETQTEDQKAGSA